MHLPMFYYFHLSAGSTKKWYRKFIASDGNEKSLILLIKFRLYWIIAHFSAPSAHTYIPNQNTS